MPDPGRLFTDETRQDQLKTDSEILTLVREVITTEMIAPEAAQTVDLVVTVAPLIRSAALYVSVGSKYQSRLNRANLKMALDDALANSKTSLEIRVSTAHLYFGDGVNPITYLDWNKILTTAPASAVPAVAPLTAVDIAQAVAQAIPKVMTAVELAATLAPLTSGSSSGGSTASSATGAAFSSSYSTQYVMSQFNPGALPADVKTRYENKLKGGNIVGSTVLQPFSGGNFYHLHGTDTIFLADGSMFIMGQNLNEKGFLKAVCYCEDDSHAGVRSWYNMFVQVVHDYGYYAHPLWCFQKDHGGDS